MEVRTSARLSLMERPLPPENLRDVGFDIEPAMEVAEWFTNAFIKEGAPLGNSDHAHLREADIACLWTNVEYVNGLRPVVGTAELVRLSGKPWQKVRTCDHLRLLFGRIPDFIITFYAPYAYTASDAAWCALAEHELYHCAQKLDQDGMPKFDGEGKPVWAIRPHDVEEFHGVVRRYGAGAASSGVAQLVEIAGRAPEVEAANIVGVCGTGNA